MYVDCQSKNLIASSRSAAAHVACALWPQHPTMPCAAQLHCIRSNRIHLPACPHEFVLFLRVVHNSIVARVVTQLGVKNEAHAASIQKATHAPQIKTVDQA